MGLGEDYVPQDEVFVPDRETEGHPRALSTGGEGNEKYMVMEFPDESRSRYQGKDMTIEDYTELNADAAGDDGFESLKIGKDPAEYDTI